MVKADLVDLIYEKIGFTKNEACQSVDTLFDVIKETLESGENITISGFGSFILRKKNERIGRNPKTGKEVPISSRRVLTFKPSKGFKENVKIKTTA